MIHRYPFHSSDRDRSAYRRDGNSGHHHTGRSRSTHRSTYVDDEDTWPGQGSRGGMTTVGSSHGGAFRSDLVHRDRRSESDAYRYRRNPTDGWIHSNPYRGPRRWDHDLPATYSLIPSSLGSLDHRQQTYPTIVPPIPTLPERPPPSSSPTSTAPSIPPIPLSPTAEYIQISLTPSQSIDPASYSRKLLILDLNGTLLLRSSQARKDSNPNGPSAPGPRLRRVYPRPYLSAFRAYIFATQTRSWLDTMVWSSAQPRSVNDMVEKCFGEEREWLVAVWSRDTLGLTNVDYHRKTQTTKDLSKPWSQLPLTSSAEWGQPSNIPGLLDFDQTQPQVHSALTTILLDDSLLKARLQPWNHVCVSEYVSHMRARDLQMWEREKADGVSALRGAKKTKKKEKGKQTKADENHSAEDSSPTATYDETLLAIVGVLDAIKGESNVAGWIRAGGLWGVGVEDYEGDRTVLDERGDMEANKAGNDSGEYLTPPDHSSRSSERVDSTASSLPTLDVEHPPMMWFEKRSVAAYWAARGRKALEELGIEADPGVDP